MEEEDEDEARGAQGARKVKARRTLVAGKLRDFLSDKDDDLSKMDKRKECEGQCEKSAVFHYGLDGKTFSKARDKPVTGADWWPKKLGSSWEPEWLCGLRGCLLERARLAIMLAHWSLQVGIDRAEIGLALILKTPSIPISGFYL